MIMSTVSTYIELIRAFLVNSLSASDFEQRYLTLFKNDLEPKPKHVFLLLDELFSDVDAFCEDPQLRDENDIDEDELRVRCEAVLAKLAD